MSAAKTKKKRQRTHRYTSNVFSMFNQDQIQEFKEAFNMIDQNRDGFIDKEDLIEMLTSLGKNPTDIYLDTMILEAPGPINFTMFLTLFGEKLNGTDPEDVIRNAFGCFDLKNLGNIPEDKLREIMTTMGDRWSDEKVDELFHGAPIRDGLFDYIEFTRTLKHGSKEKDDDTDPPPTPTTPKPEVKLQPKTPEPPTPVKVPNQHAVPLKTALKQPKPQPKGPKPQVTTQPPLPKNQPPKTPPTGNTVSSPFGAALKNTGKFPPYKKF